MRLQPGRGTSLPEASSLAAAAPAPGGPVRRFHRFIAVLTGAERAGWHQQELWGYSCLETTPAAANLF